MRLLDALAPNTEAGMIVGPTKAIPAATAELFKNSRRVHVFVFLVLLLFIAFPYF
jgi:hypothetical protein